MRSSDWAHDTKQDLVRKNVRQAGFWWFLPYFLDQLCGAISVQKVSPCINIWFIDLIPHQMGWWIQLITLLETGVIEFRWLQLTSFWFQIDAEYEFKEVLGEGSFGKVHKVPAISIQHVLQLACAKLGGPTQTYRYPQGCKLSILYGSHGLMDWSMDWPMVLLGAQGGEGNSSDGWRWWFWAWAQGKIFQLSFQTFHSYRAPLPCQWWILIPSGNLT